MAEVKRGGRIRWGMGYRIRPDRAPLQEANPAGDRGGDGARSFTGYAVKLAFACKLTAMKWSRPSRLTCINRIGLSLFCAASAKLVICAGSVTALSPIRSMTSPRLQALIDQRRVVGKIDDDDAFGAVVEVEGRARFRRQGGKLCAQHGTFDTVAVIRIATLVVVIAWQRPSASNLPISTVTSFSWPARSTSSVAFEPGSALATRRGRSRISMTLVPLKPNTTSPGFRSALAAGLVGSILAMSAPLGSLEAQALGQIRRDLLDFDTQPAAFDRAFSRNSATTVLARLLGMAKPMPTEPPRGRDDRGVDADHIAAHIEGRAAGIALVDGGVDLQEIVERSFVDVTAPRRDDAGGDRTAEAERVADSHDPIADARLVGIAPGNGGERLLRLRL